MIVILAAYFIIGFISAILMVRYWYDSDTIPESEKSSVVLISIILWPLIVGFALYTIIDWLATKFFDFVCKF